MNKAKILAVTSILILLVGAVFVAAEGLSLGSELNIRINVDSGEVSSEIGDGEPDVKLEEVKDDGNTNSGDSSGSSSGGSSSGSSSGGSSGGGGGGGGSSREPSKKVEIAANENPDFESFRAEFEVSDSVAVTDEAVSVYKERKKVDSKNVESVANVAKTASSDNRVKASVELFRIEKEFVERMEEAVSTGKVSEVSIRDQVDNYIGNIETKEEIGLEINDDKIREFFDKPVEERDIEEFMKALLD